MWCEIENCQDEDAHEGIRKWNEKYNIDLFEKDTPITVDPVYYFRYKNKAHRRITINRYEECCDSPNCAGSVSIYIEEEMADA